MKLKCDAHDRRVLVLDGKFAHRTGDMSKCDSKTATIGDRKYEVTSVSYKHSKMDLAFTESKVTQVYDPLVMQVDIDPRWYSHTPDGRALMAIFGVFDNTSA